MGFWSRIFFVVRMKSKAALDRAENPIQVLEYADDQQRELLRRVKQGLIEVAISKRQVQQQVDALEAKVPMIEDQAKRALSAGRQDLARVALERKQTALAELDGLEQQVADIEDEEQRLIAAEQQLSARIEQFRMQRQTLAARYSAAEAQVQVREALSGVSQEFTTLGMAIGRADEKIQRMLAHASAIDSLVDSGVLGSQTVDGDIVERELREVAVREAVTEELKALQAEVDAKKALEEGKADGSSG